MIVEHCLQDPPRFRRCLRLTGLLVHRRGSAAASGSPTSTTPEQRDGPATKKDGEGP